MWNYSVKSFSETGTNGSYAVNISPNYVMPLLAGYQWFPEPEDSPALNQPGMDSFSPTNISDTSPHALCPKICRVTHKSCPSGCVWITGDRFDDLMSLWVYSEVNGSSDFSECQKLYRSGNMALYRISPFAKANSFMLAWILHPSYGYSEPYPINQPEGFTLNCDFYGTTVARVGDNLRVGGINISSKQGTERCWAYLKKSGSSGTWIAANEVDEGHAIFTIPSLPNGAYEVWTHTGRGGRWGWNKHRYTLTIESPKSLLSDRQAPAPSGGDDKNAIQSIINAFGQPGAPPGYEAYIILQPGTYRFDSALSNITGWAGGAHLKGAGIDQTTIILTNGALCSVTNGSMWVEDLTIDCSSAPSSGGHFSASSVLGGVKRLKNVKVIGPSTNYWKIGISFNLIHNCDILGGAQDEHVLDFYGWMRNTTIRKLNGPEGAIFSVFGATNCAVDTTTIVDAPGNDGDGGRFYIRGGGTTGTSLCNCTTVNLAVTNNDQNKGEQILIDGGYLREKLKANGGTSRTIKFSPSEMATSGVTLNITTTATSSNATSSTPTISFSGSSNDTRGGSVLITGGTNSIPGLYSITSRSGDSLTLSGGPIGTVNSLSGISAQVIQFPYETKLTSLSSSNANSSTPTISGANFSSHVGRFIYFSDGVTPIVRKITSGTSTTCVIDGSISGSASVSGLTAYIYDNYANVFGAMLAVLGGKGLGQFGKITSHTTDGTDIIIGVDRDFRVSTDSTSIFHVFVGSLDTAIYNCNLSGDGAQLSVPVPGGASPAASCGFESFSPNAGCYFWGGSISGVKWGLIDWAPGVGIIGTTSCSIWNYFGDMSIYNCSTFFRSWGSSANYQQEISLSLSVLQNLTVSDISTLGNGAASDTWLEDWGPTGNYCWNNVQISGNGKIALFNYYRDPGGTLILNNCSINIGSGTFSGSRAKAAGSTMVVSQFNPSSGQFIGFQS